MSNAEIGAVMERTEGAIMSLFHRTLLSLRSASDGGKTVRRTRTGDDLSDGRERAESARKCARTG